MRRLEAQRVGARHQLVVALDGERYRDLLRRFREQLPLLGVGDRGRLAEVAGRELRRLLRAHAELGPEPADTELHRLRIKAKRTRYAAELAAQGGGGKLARVAEAAKALQDAIGVHQDAVVAEQRVRAVAGDAAIAAGRIVELERSRRREVRAGLPKLWKKLDRAAAKAL